MNEEEYQELLNEKIKHSVEQVFSEAEDFLTLHTSINEPVHKLLMLGAYLDMVVGDILKMKNGIMAGSMTRLGEMK